MRVIKQSSNRNIMVLIVQSSDHITGLTGATLTVTASKDGAAFASISPTVTERGSGWYNLALTTSHTDTLGDLAIHVTAASADPADLACQVVAYDTTDATALGLSRIDAAVTSRMATFTLPTNFSSFSIDASGRVDVIKVAGTTQTARDLGANIDVATSTRLATASYTAPDNASVATILTRTDVATSSRMAAFTLPTNFSSFSISATGGVTLETTDLTTVRKVLINAQKTDPATGLRTVYDDDSVTPLYTANVYNDAAGTILFNGTAGINKTNKLS
jgi:hypothetical protein